jgi:hypothetical protein
MPSWGIPRPSSKPLGLLLGGDTALLWSVVVGVEDEIPWETLLPILLAIVVHGAGDMAMR